MAGSRFSPALDKPCLVFPSAAFSPGDRCGPDNVPRRAGARCDTSGAIMKKIVQVKVSKGDRYYVGECVDLPVVTQGESLDEIANNIREAISLHLEGEDLQEWDLLPDFSILLNFELEPTYAKA